MLFRPLGPSGIAASAVAFGAWGIGGWPWGASDDADAIDAIQAALDAGINLIDTAPIYGFGKSETLVGCAIAGRRREVIIATKCGLRWDGEEGGEFFREATIPDTGKPIRVYKNLRPESIRKEVEASLRRLHTNYIDLYQTHWQEATTPIEDTMGCLLDLKREGKIRAIGVSNATLPQMDAYRAHGQFDVDQERYSMIDRELKATNMAYCRQNGIAFFAYSPLSHGLLSGKVRPGHAFLAGDFWREHERFSEANIARIQPLQDTLRPIARAHGLTLAQLVIQWTLQESGCAHVLCGARDARQVCENAAAADNCIGTSELQLISKAIASCT